MFVGGGSAFWRSTRGRAPGSPGPGGGGEAAGAVGGEDPGWPAVGGVWDRPARVARIAAIRTDAKASGRAIRSSISVPREGGGLSGVRDSPKLALTWHDGFAYSWPGLGRLG